MKILVWLTLTLFWLQACTIFAGGGHVILPVLPAWQFVIIVLAITIALIFLGKCITNHAWGWLAATPPLVFVSAALALWFWDSVLMGRDLSLFNSVDLWVGGYFLAVIFVHPMFLFMYREKNGDSFTAAIRAASYPSHSLRTGMKRLGPSTLSLSAVAVVTLANPQAEAIAAQAQADTNVDGSKAQSTHEAQVTAAAEGPKVADGRGSGSPTPLEHHRQEGPLDPDVEALIHWEEVEREQQQRFLEALREQVGLSDWLEAKREYQRRFLASLREQARQADEDDA